jgi:hypothetical protein
MRGVKMTNKETDDWRKKRNEILQKEGFEEISEEEQLRRMMRHSSIIYWD